MKNNTNRTNKKRALHEYSSYEYDEMIDKMNKAKSRDSKFKGYLAQRRDQRREQELAMDIDEKFTKLCETFEINNCTFDILKHTVTNVSVLVYTPKRRSCNSIAVVEIKSDGTLGGLPSVSKNRSALSVSDQIRYDLVRDLIDLYNESGLYNNLKIYRNMESNVYAMMNAMIPGVLVNNGEDMNPHPQERKYVNQLVNKIKEATGVSVWKRYFIGNKGVSAEKLQFKLENYAYVGGKQSRDKKVRILVVRYCPAKTIYGESPQISYYAYVKYNKAAFVMRIVVNKNTLAPYSAKTGFGPTLLLLKELGYLNAEDAYPNDKYKCNLYNIVRLFNMITEQSGNDTFVTDLLNTIANIIKHREGGLSSKMTIKLDDVVKQSKKDEKTISDALEKLKVETNNDDVNVDEFM